MTAERIFVRCTLTAICVLVSVVLFPALLLLKVLEAVHLGTKITHESVAQVWRSRGLPGLDK